VTSGSWVIPGHSSHLLRSRNYLDAVLRFQAIHGPDTQCLLLDVISPFPLTLACGSPTGTVFTPSFALYAIQNLLYAVDYCWRHGAAILSCKDTMIAVSNSRLVSLFGVPMPPSMNSFLARHSLISFLLSQCLWLSMASKRAAAPFITFMQVVTMSLVVKIPVITTGLRLCQRLQLPQLCNRDGQFASSPQESQRW